MKYSCSKRWLRIARVLASPIRPCRTENLCACLSAASARAVFLARENAKPLVLGALFSCFALDVSNALFWHASPLEKPFSAGKKDFESAALSVGTASALIVPAPLGRPPVEPAPHGPFAPPAPPAPPARPAPAAPAPLAPRKPAPAAPFPKTPVKSLRSARVAATKNEPERTKIRSIVESARLLSKATPALL